MQNELDGLVDNDKDICSILGKFFNSVYSPQTNDEMPDMETLCNIEIGDIVITKDEIMERLVKINVNIMWTGQYTPLTLAENSRYNLRPTRANF